MNRIFNDPKRWQYVFYLQLFQTIFVGFTPRELSLKIFNIVLLAIVVIFWLISLKVERDKK